MRYAHRGVVVLLLLGAGARVAGGQAPRVAVSELLPNERLQLSSTTVGVERSERVIVVRTGGDTLWVAMRRGEAAIPLLVREVRSAKVARGQRTSLPRAVLGGVAGSVVGFAAGWLSCIPLTCGDGIYGDDFAFRVLLGFGAGAIGGAKLGYGPHDVWRPVAIPARGR